MHFFTKKANQCVTHIFQHNFKRLAALFLIKTELYPSINSNFINNQ
ncbi:MAG: hypothetical protein ACI9LN_002849, partial [Saprospiraceae bacterium]